MTTTENIIKTNIKESSDISSSKFSIMKIALLIRKLYDEELINSDYADPLKILSPATKNMYMRRILLLLKQCSEAIAIRENIRRSNAI